MLPLHLLLLFDLLTLLEILLRVLSHLLLLLQVSITPVFLHSLLNLATLFHSVPILSAAAHSQLVQILLLVVVLGAAEGGGLRVGRRGRWEGRRV